MPPKSATTKDRSKKNIKVNKGNRSLPPPAEDDDSTKCDDDDDDDAILVTRLELGEEEEMKQDAKDALGQALQEEELHVEDVRGEIFVGNRRSLSLAAPKDMKISSLEDRVSSLTSSLDAYKLLRHRFISAFKRDKLASATEADKRIIGAGNAWAHGDALLYTGTGGRTDVKAFQKLYGMSPWDVQMLKFEEVSRLTYSAHKETITVLNTHAGVVASKHKTGSDKFYKLFAEFVNLFKESGEGYEQGYLDGNPTDVTHAYWAFVNCINDEVTRVEAAEASD
ncbi:hypothetical protein FN846DRAFT_1025664 [Sphaerosporella brunnea]|uniref:Uncharacterized protein n=1 Tax=Sphaerosporella brunnea TaxID=1250544 RepID=A0A5J5EF32_9PEZI|nr:hypothetical protein FN846DRAFT_1025664 [Sphaerosporella brunnea]